jgi:Glycosyltransferase family 87
MATVEIASSGRGAAALPRSAELICFALVVALAVYLAASYRQGAWILAADGSGMLTDFVNVWAAGKLVLQGTPALAYDWTAQKAMQVVTLSHPFDGYFAWHYPPTFLILAVALAMLPYVTAFVLWGFGTFAVCLFVADKIVGERSGVFLAAAFPAVLANFIAGQNGFFSAALLGGGLLILIEGPILAVVLLGILTYKPHLALLVPIALIAGGHERALLVAAIVAALMTLVSWAAFGTAPTLATPRRPC